MGAAPKLMACPFSCFCYTKHKRSAAPRAERRTIFLNIPYIKLSGILPLYPLLMRCFLFWGGVLVSSQKIPDSIHFRRCKSVLCTRNLRTEPFQYLPLLHDPMRPPIQIGRFQDAAVSKNDVRVAGDGVCVKQLLQTSEVVLVLDHWVKKIVALRSVFSSGEGFQPLFLVFIPEYPSGIILDFKYIDPGFMDHEEVYFCTAPSLGWDIAVLKDTLVPFHTLQRLPKGSLSRFSLIRRG